MKNRQAIVAALIGMAMGLGGCVTIQNSPEPLRAPQSEESARNEIVSLLDTLHTAAANAEGQKYFRCFADDAIFLGTASEERWTKRQFQEYAQARFDAGKGWTYFMTERNIEIARGGRFAWFDERLVNEKYGECRGTGVLVYRGSRWQIAQYNLTVPIPNDLLPDVAKQIQAYEAEKKAR